MGSDESDLEVVGVVKVKVEVWYNAYARLVQNPPEPLAYAAIPLFRLFKTPTVDLCNIDNIAQVSLKALGSWLI